MSLISGNVLVLLNWFVFIMPRQTDGAIAHENGANLNDFDYFNDHHQHKAQLFNPYNQYTVDQLLVKVPSILEEPETSDSNVDISLQKSSSEASSSTLNQNVFQSESNQTKFVDSSLRPISADHNLLAKSTNRYRSIKRLLSQIQFNCSGRQEGYYADVDFDCHIFHYCKHNGFKFTFICPGNSVFSQEELTCDNAMRNPEQSCRRSANYYFLNSMLYTKNNDPSLSATSVNNATGHHQFDSAFEKDFGKWVTYIATGTVNNPFSSTSTTKPITTKLPVTFKSKRNKPKSTKPQSMENVKLITKFSKLASAATTTSTNTPAYKVPMEKYSSELSISHSPTLPDFLLTSPSPPLEQIDTPKWFPQKENLSNDLTHNLDMGSVNIYNQKGNSQSSITFATTTSTTVKPPVRIHFDDKIKSPSEMTEVINDINSISPVMHNHFTRTSKNKIASKFQPNRKNVQSKHKISNPFQVDWDDDDQMLVEEFQHQTRINKLPHVVKAPITLASEDSANYLFGKPMENIPEEQFSPVEFESLLEKIPHDMQTLPMMSSPLDHQHPLSHFGNFPSVPLPPLHLMGNSHQSKPTPKSQIKLLLGNLVGGSNKIARRWFQRGSDPMPNIWPLVDGIASRRHENNELIQTRVRRPSRHLESPYLSHHSRPNMEAQFDQYQPFQMLEIRRSDGEWPRNRGGWSRLFSNLSNQNKHL